VSPVQGNRITLLRNGTEYFPALEAAIDSATRQIYLQSYIFADDVTGRRIAEALARAVTRGVAVHVLVDAYGSRSYLKGLREEMVKRGIAFLQYRPEVSWLSLGRNRLRRMHRKVAVVDGRIAFVGGINIIDDMHTPRHKPPRYDYAVRVEGPLVEHVLEQAHSLWSLTAWTTFNQQLDAPVRTMPDATPKGFQHAAYMVRDNFRHRSDIEDAYLEAIESAREEIVIACAYFFPGRRFRRALVQAAERGVRVIVLLQGRVEYILLHYATRALYGTLLDAGVEIFEYHASFMHAKVAVVDLRWATVGSSNIDPFSLLLAREANIVVEDRRFAIELRASLAERMADGAEPVRKQRWRRRPLRERALIWIAYGISRMLIGVFGYGRLH
jgi:cardiolipin synthase